ncbi:MAG: NAD(P)H-dependent oxidoreductase [archaeon]
MENLKEVLNWRYATKSFDAKKKIPAKDFDELLESLRLAPSSFGLQPYKFVVVKDMKLRESIKNAAWGQSQVTDASNLIVLCARKDLSVEYINDFVAEVANTRGVSVESLKGLHDMLLRSVKSRNKEQIHEWNKRQAYITLGFVLLSAASKKIDACPMEGFDAKKVDEILNLTDTEYGSVAFCALGYRAKEDKYASAKKVRFAKEKLFDFR